MSEKIETTTKPKREIQFSEIFYVFLKNLIWEILIFVVVLGIGFCVALNSKPYYTTDSTIIVKVNLAGNVSTETSMARYYVIPVFDVVKTNVFTDRVQSKLGYEKDMIINPNNLIVSYDENSIVVSLTYRDSDASNSMTKLTAIVRELESFANEQDADGSKYFSADIKINAVPFSNGSYVSAPVKHSDSRKIILLSAGVGAVAVVGFVFCMLIFADKISTVAKLENLTGKKNFITIEKKRSKKKNGNSPENGEEEFLNFKVNKLSDTLIYLKDGDKNKVYQIQSCNSGEGKTTVAVNLAANLGSDDRKVLIIDCDFSHPSLHRAFKLSRKVGITDYFKGNINFDGMLKHTGYNNVDLITCGDYISDHTIFFTSDKFKAIIKEAKEKYDFILLDCAPVKALSDYIHISQLSDATLLVVESDKISARELNSVVAELESCDANLVGTVFNFCTISRSKNYYYHYGKESVDVEGSSININDKTDKSADENQIKE